MFDLTRLTEAIGGILGQSAANIEPSNVFEQLSSAGLDLGDLQNLDPEYLITTLSEQGIDVAGLDLAELTALAEQGGLTDLLPEILSRTSEGQP